MKYHDMKAGDAFVLSYHGDIITYLVLSISHERTTVCRTSSLNDSTEIMVFLAPDIFREDTYERICLMCI
jgi:hypothetical protein